MRFFFTIFLLSVIGVSSAQDQISLDASSIPSELTENANAVIRYEDMQIEVKAYNRMALTYKRIVTILNSAGNVDHGAVMAYDPNRNIKKITAIIYDSKGAEIKKFRKNDFNDVAAVSDGTLYSDSRLKFLGYTPTSYPYTIEFETEVEYQSTAFVPEWNPIEGFYISTEFSEYKIVNNSNVGLKFKTQNLENYSIETHADFHYSAKNLQAIVPEAYSPPFAKYAPNVKVALIEFEMEGVRGINTNWQEFGKWMYEKLLTGTDELPESAKSEIRSLTAGLTDDVEKARIVYDYVQKKTRYISVQVGIGGWKPMLAEDVDRLGYADCKGLSNYTKALLDEVGVNSYYTVIYGDQNLVDMDREFSVTEGNHIILCLPMAEQNIWLECTSQTNPFGFIAGMTDDRDALLITPEGGKIARTKAYATNTNLQTTTAKVKVTKDGTIVADVAIIAEGFQYAMHEGLQQQAKKEQEMHFKKYWNYINNMNITRLELVIDKVAVSFHENLSLEANNYATKSGNRLILSPNIFNRVTHIPPRYRSRKLPFEIERGWRDDDEYLINLASGLEVEALPTPISLSNKFGTYSFEVEQISPNQLKYMRSLIVHKGNYSQEDYSEFRKFREEISKNDNAKIILISNQ